MPTNRKRRSRKRGKFTPLQMAILTGGALPENVSPWYVDNLENPDAKGLLSVGVCATPFAEVWQSYHGAPMTDADRAALRDRLPEIRAAADLTRTRHNTAAPGSASPSNWPDDQTDDFQSIGTLDEGIEK